MGGRVKNPQLNKADAILFAEQSGSSLTVYYVRGKYHMIHTNLEAKLSPLAKIIHRTRQIGLQTFRYDEGRYVREEDVNERGEIINRRLLPKIRNREESKDQRKRRRSA